MANALGELFGDIASAIREKTGDEGKMKPAQFPEKISEIETGADVSVVTATAEDVLKGKKFVDAGGNVIDGTMPNLGSKIIWWRNRPIRNPEAINQGGIAILEIEEGYHDGTSGIQLTFENPKRYTPTKKRKRFSSSYSTGMFLGDIDIDPIPDQYQDVTPVTATAEDVRAGKVFVDAEGNAVEGSLSGTIADVSGVTATAADVRQGKVFVDAEGTEVTGTLVVEQKAPDVIWVGKDSVANAQVGTGVVRYVTFMNDDGTVTYGQKSVLVGTDCIEPVAGGYMDAPTKESTAEHTFTFSGGWATEPGGGINADALKNVTEDRTVYANFIAAVRYYTIRFYDGETLVHTESVPYGGSSTYTHNKGDYIFQGWTPEPTNITGDLACYGSWVESVDFANASWETIIRVSESGMASTVFALGDQKELTFTDPKGTEQTVTLEIVGFDTDALSNGEKVGMTIMAVNVVNCYPPMTTSNPTSENPYMWSTCDLRSKLRTVTLPSFPEALRNGIKAVRKISRIYKDGTDTTGLVTTEDKLWIPSAGEFDISKNQYIKDVAPEDDGIKYTTTVKKNDAYWLRSGVYTSSFKAYTVNTSGKAQPNNTVAGSYLIFGFCV